MRDAQALVAIALSDAPFPAEVARDDLGNPALLDLLDHDEAAVVRLAFALGDGPAFADALLERLEGLGYGPLTDDALLALVSDDVAHDPVRNGRAGAILADAGRFDLLVAILARHDPHRMLVDAYEQVVRKPPVDVHLTRAVAAALAVGRPGDLTRAAALIPRIKGQHAAFLAAARAANPGLLPATIADIKGLWGG